MPLLQFDTTLSLSAAEKTSFADAVTELYTTEMDTTDGHVAVTIRNRKPADLHLGRAVDGPLLFLNAGGATVHLGTRTMTFAELHADAEDGRRGWNGSTAGTTGGTGRPLPPVTDGGELR